VLKKVGKYSFFFLLSASAWVFLFIIHKRFWVNFLITGFHIRPYSNLTINLIFASLLIFTAAFLDQVIRRTEKWDVIDLLWKLLVVGIAGVTITFVAEVAEEYMKSNSLHPLLVAINASVSLYMLLFFLFSAIIVFQKLILYQRNKLKLFLWRMLLLLIGLAFVRLFLRDSHPAAQWLQSILLPAFVVVSLVLATNMNWSAYLNFNQKLRSLFLMSLILLLFGAFYYSNFLYFGRFLDGVSYNSAYEPFLPSVLPRFMDLFLSRFQVLGFLFLFPLIYALVATLVLIFNLPTSSVFELRSSELASIQRITHSIQTNLDTVEILRTLLDASLLTSNATGGWIEVPDPDNEGNWKKLYAKSVTDADAAIIHKIENLRERTLEDGRQFHIRSLKRSRGAEGKSRFGSLLALPVRTRDNTIAMMYIVNELAGSFEEETMLSLVAFSDQAGIAVENADLVSKSIGLERYMEQVKIAKEVQEKILPLHLPGNHRISFHAVHQEVEEIGGDFYDVRRVNDNHYKVALGDVSGKGITAAFYMAETKGIFQALTNLDLGVKDFIVTANKAVSGCFSKGAFLTLTYMDINLEKGFVSLMRAGHCPTIFYNSKTDKLEVLERGGPGLAILRDESFESYCGMPETIWIQPGDMLVLFTDGIMEARNSRGEEFGIGRMIALVERLRKSDAKLVAETLLREAKKFSGGVLQDDYTILAIKLH
jgi:phosphoserine phosphatase RsbU/P